MVYHKKTKETVLEEGEYLRNVQSPTKLSGKFISGVSGSSYDESIHLAFEWAKKVNADKSSKHVVELRDCYLQIMGKKSILFSYDLTEKPNE